MRRLLFGVGLVMATYDAAWAQPVVADVPEVDPGRPPPALDDGTATPLPPPVAVTPDPAPADTPPVDTPPPDEVLAPPPEVTAIDGDARNYELSPERSSIRGAFIVRGLGTGVGYLFRGLLAPVRGLVYLEARWHTLSKLKKLLVNDAGTLGIYPQASYSTGFGISYGAKAFMKDYLGADEDVSLSAKTGGATRQAYQFKLELPHLGGSPIYVHARARYEDNGNLLFAGIGNPGERSGQMLGAMDSQLHTRFSQQRFLGMLSTGVQVGDKAGPRLKLGGSAIFNDREFGEGDAAASDPSIETVYDTSTLRGFTAGFRNLELTGDITLDTRDVVGPTHTGGVVRGFVGGGSLVQDATYLHYGAEATYFVEPWLPGRVFVGRIALEGMRDKDGDTPFTELPRLGGGSTLRGYYKDQFRDNLATVATLEYHYPIHALLSGDLFVNGGKVANTYDALLGGGLQDNWHFGYGGGLIVHSKSSIKVRLDVAYGDGLQFYFTTDVFDAFHSRETEL